MSEQPELTEEQKAGFEYHRKLVSDLQHIVGEWQAGYEEENKPPIDYVTLYRKFVIAVGEVACMLAIDSGLEEAAFVDLMQKMHKARLSITPRFT